MTFSSIIRTLGRSPLATELLNKLKRHRYVQLSGVARLPKGFGVTLRMSLPGGGFEEADIGSGGAVVELDRKSMVRLLFGPERATDIPGVDPSLVQLDTIFPLPFCIQPLFSV